MFQGSASSQTQYENCTHNHTFFLVYSSWLSVLQTIYYNFLDGHLYWYGSLKQKVINVMISNEHKTTIPHHILDYIFQQANNKCMHQVLTPMLTTARILEIFYS